MTLASWFTSVKQSRRRANRKATRRRNLLFVESLEDRRLLSTIDGITGVVALYPFNNPADLGQDTSGTGNDLITDTGTPAYSSQG